MCDSSDEFLFGLCCGFVIGAYVMFIVALIRSRNALKQSPQRKE